MYLDRNYNVAISTRAAVRRTPPNEGRFPVLGGFPWRWFTSKKLMRLGLALDELS